MGDARKHRDGRNVLSQESMSRGMAGAALQPLALRNVQENRGLARGRSPLKRKEKPEKEQNPLP